MVKDGNRWIKPVAEFTMSVRDRQKFCSFIKGVKFPDAFASNLKKNITDNDSKITGLKSHDCHVLMQRLLPVGIRPFLNRQISATIIELCNFFQQICSRTLRVEDIEKAEEHIVLVLSKLELIFPPAFFDIMIHLVMHLPEEAILGGPVQMRWMYPFERFMKTLKEYVRNRARPEGSIAEGYVVNEALTFCSKYLKGVETRFNRPERNLSLNEDSKRINLSIFKSIG